MTNSPNTTGLKNPKKYFYYNVTLNYLHFKNFTHLNNNIIFIFSSFFLPFGQRFLLHAATVIKKRKSS